MKKTLIVLLMIMTFYSCEAIVPAVAVPTYFNYVKKSRGSEAELYINTIFKQAAIFYTKEGRVPTTLDEMKDINLLYLDPKAEKTWTFDLSQLEEPTDEAGDSAGLRGKITATSTEEMGGGAGETVEFNAETGEFCGYGHAECSGS